MFPGIRKQHVRFIATWQEILEEVQQVLFHTISVEDQIQVLDEWDIPETGRRPHHSAWITLITTIATLRFDIHTVAWNEHRHARSIFITLRKFIGIALSYCQLDFTCFLSLALWVQARLLFQTWPTTSHFNAWLDRFKELGLSIYTYTADFHRSRCGVYILLNPESRHCYATLGPQTAQWREDITVDSES